jgi:hypothetical protein
MGQGRADPSGSAGGLRRPPLEGEGDGGGSHGIARRSGPPTVLPGVACPPGGPVGLRAPPALVLGSAQPAPLPLAGRLACRALPDPLGTSLRACCPVRAAALGAAPRPPQGLWSPGPPVRACAKETEGAPTVPRSPSGGLPRSQPPGVSCARALAPPGRWPAGHGQPSAFPAVLLKALLVSTRSAGRGSLTRPAASFHRAPYAHAWVGTWRSLPSCWHGFHRMGLEPSRLAPPG